MNPDHLHGDGVARSHDYRILEFRGDAAEAADFARALMQDFKDTQAVTEGHPAGGYTVRLMRPQEWFCIDFVVAYASGWMRAMLREKGAH